MFDCDRQALLPLPEKDFDNETKQSVSFIICGHVYREVKTISLRRKFQTERCIYESAV